MWTLARAAAKRLRARIDVSGDQTFQIIADDVSSVPAKVVRGLRTVARKRHTDKFMYAAHQGKVAKSLALDAATKDITRQVSTRTELGFDDWRYLYRARLDLLPLRGYVWSLCRSFANFADEASGAKTPYSQASQHQMERGPGRISVSTGQREAHRRCSSPPVRRTLSQFCAYSLPFVRILFARNLDIECVKPVRIICVEPRLH